jgi:transcriptional regulator GlxA family with amidase domain
MVHRVAVLAFEGISVFHLSVPTLVFGADLPGSLADYEVTICAEKPGALRTSAGFDLSVPTDLSAFDVADTVVIPSWSVDDPVPHTLVDALCAAHRRGARIVGLCLGAYVVAASGLVDGREATTHWHAADQLAKRHPEVSVRSDVLWSDLGDIVTSAGTVAGLDCCLHLVRHDHGATVAAEVAKRLVMAPHRGGSQAQFIPVPVPPDEMRDPIAEAMAWASIHLSEQVDLDTWAQSATMSRRTFTRQFRERTGGSPGSWLAARRLDHARILLETTDLPIDAVAEASGFGSAVALRTHFRNALGASPTRHRQQFGVLSSPA